MGNPFLKAQQAKAAIETPAPQSKLVNPFQKSNSAGDPAPSKATISNPFAKSAVGAAPVSPDTAPTPAPAVSSSPVQDTAGATPVNAEEFTHETQPVEYTQEQVDNLQLALTNLQNSFEGKKEQIENAIRLVGTQLADHPALCGVMRPTDWGLFVSGLRESYGTAIVKRGERRGKSEAKSKLAEEAANIIDSIDGFDF